METCQIQEGAILYHLTFTLIGWLVWLGLEDRPQQGVPRKSGYHFFIIIGFVMRLNNLFTGKMFFSLAGILIVALILSGCGIGLTDAGNEQEYHTIDAPSGEYRSVAWLTDNLIAFNYSAFEYGSTNVDDWSESLIALHKIGADGWSVTKQLPKPERCRVGFISFLSRLPNGRVGFVYHCTYNAPSGTLYSWDFENDALNQIYDYPDPFFATTYTFNPSMSELIQTESTGLSESLFRVDLNQKGQLEELFTNYVRVRVEILVGRPMGKPSLLPGQKFIQVLLPILKTGRRWKIFWIIPGTFT